MNPFRILVADDDEDHLFFIRRALESIDGVDLEIDAVRDGEEALDFLHRRGRFVDARRPHLFLLDLRMPRKDGLEVLEEVKSHADLRSIPVSILTSSDRPEDVHATSALGASSYLRKSADPRGLEEQLQDLRHHWTGTAEVPEPAR